MSDLVQIETLILILLLVAIAVAVLVRRFRIPYTVALVIAGLALSLFNRIPIHLTSEIILFLFIPPLLFEAAFHLNPNQLRQNITTLLILAIPGVIISMLIVGGMVAWGAGLSLGTAILFGALIAATDPVSVVAIFRKLGAPKRLEVLLEGESLFNDGTAIVIYNIAVAVVLTGSFGLVEGETNLLQALIDFVRIAGGGILVGVVLGWAVARFMATIDDHLVETMMTIVLAFGAFLLAEQLHVSGVLSVVAAGLMVGNVGSNGMSPTTRLVVLNFWESVAFLANSAIFLLIGLDIDLAGLIANWQPILWAIVAVLVARAFNIYVLSRLGPSIPSNWRPILWWGGLRGAIALALALSIPLAVGDERRTVILMTFGVVLFTLLVQGLSMDWLMQKLNIIVRSDDETEYERRNARALAARAGYQHLEHLYDEGIISDHTWGRLDPVLSARSKALGSSVQEILRQAPHLEKEEFETANRELLRSQRNMVIDLQKDGVISAEVQEELVSEIDLVLESDSVSFARRALMQTSDSNVSHLIAAVVQDEDLESVLNALSIRGIRATRIQSSGGFLRRENHLLLIGITDGELKETIGVINAASRSRIQYLASPFGEAPISEGLGERVQLHGSTVFTFTVDRYEEL